MKQSFLFIYFVLYLVALVSLLPLSSGGRVPCKQIADSLATIFSDSISLSAPQRIHVRIYRLNMGNRVLDTKSDTSRIYLIAKGLTTPEERTTIAYRVESTNKGPALTCVTEAATGIGLITNRFTQRGVFHYRVTAEVRRHIPANLPKCVREMLSGLDGKTLTAGTEFEVVVEYDDFAAPC